jgi:hypothetical protein
MPGGALVGGSRGWLGPNGVVGALVAVHFPVGTEGGPLTSAFTVISGPVRCVGTAGFEPATP